MFEALNQSLRATKIEKLTSLETAYKPGAPFSLFVNPLDENEPYGVITIQAKPDKNTTSVEVPIITGDWNPIIFESLDAESINLTKYDVYAALMTI